MVFDSKIFPATKFNFASVYLELMSYHLRAIVSEQGLKLIKDLDQKCNLLI